MRVFTGFLFLFAVSNIKFDESIKVESLIHL